MLYMDEEQVKSLSCLDLVDGLTAEGAEST